MEFERNLCVGNSGDSGNKSHITRGVQTDHPALYARKLSLNKSDFLSTPPSKLKREISQLRDELYETYEFHDLELKVLSEEYGIDFTGSKKDLENLWKSVNEAEKIILESEKEINALKEVNEELKQQLDVACKNVSVLKRDYEEQISNLQTTLKNNSSEMEKLEKDRNDYEFSLELLKNNYEKKLNEMKCLLAHNNEKESDFERDESKKMELLRSAHFGRKTGYDIAHRAVRFLDALCSQLEDSKSSLNVSFSSLSSFSDDLTSSKIIDDFTEVEITAINDTTLHSDPLAVQPSCNTPLASMKKPFTNDVDTSAECFSKPFMARLSTPNKTNLQLISPMPNNLQLKTPPYQKFTPLKPEKIYEEKIKELSGVIENEKENIAQLEERIRNLESSSELLLKERKELEVLMYNKNEEINEVKVAYEEKIKELSGVIDNNKENITELEERIRILERSSEESVQERKELEVQIYEKNEEMNDVKVAYEEKIKELNRVMDNNKENITELEERIRNLESSSEELVQERKELEVRLYTKNEEINEVKVAYEDKIRELNGVIENKKENITELEERIRILEGSSEELVQERKELEVLMYTKDEEMNEVKVGYEEKIKELNGVIENKRENITELEERIRNLESSSELLLKERKELEVLMYTKDEEINEVKLAYEEKIKELNSVMDNNKENITELEERIRILERSSEDLVQERKELEVQIYEKNEEINEVKLAHEEKIKELNRVMDNNKENITELEERIRNLESSSEELVQERKELEVRLYTKNEEMNEVKVAYEEKIKELSGVIENKRENITELEERIRNLESSSELLLKERKELEVQIFKKNEEINEVKVGYEEKIRELNGVIDNNKENITELEERIRILEGSSEDLVQERKELEVQIYEKNEEINEVKLAHEEIIKELNGVIEYKKENITELEERIRNQELLVQERKELEVQICKKNEEMNEVKVAYEEKIKELNRVMDNITENTMELEERIRILEGSSEELVQERKELEMQIYEKNEEINEVKVAYEEKIKALNEVIENKKENVSKLEERIRNLERSSDVFVKEREDLKLEIENLNERLIENLVETDEIRRKIIVEVTSLKPEFEGTLAGVSARSLLSILLDTVMESCKKMHEELSLRNEEKKALSLEISKLNGFQLRVNNLGERIDEDNHDEVPAIKTKSESSLGPKCLSTEENSPVKSRTGVIRSELQVDPPFTSRRLEKLENLNNVLNGALQKIINALDIPVTDNLFTYKDYEEKEAQIIKFISDLKILERNKFELNSAIKEMSGPSGTSDDINDPLDEVKATLSCMIRYLELPGGTLNSQDVYNEMEKILSEGKKELLNCCETLRQKNQNLEDMNVHLQTKVEELVEENNSYKFSTKNLEKSNELLKAEIGELRSELVKAEEKIQINRKSNLCSKERKLDKLEELSQSLVDLIKKILTNAGMENTEKLNLFTIRTFNIESKKILDHLTSWSNSKLKEIQELKSQIKVLDEECEAYTKKIKEDAQKTSEGWETARNLEMQKVELEEKNKSLQSQIERLKFEKGKTFKIDKRIKSQEELENLRAKNSTLESQIKTLEDQIAHAKQQREELDEECDSLAKAVKEAEKQKVDVWEETREEVKTLKELNDKLEQDKNRLRIENEKLIEKIKTHERTRKGLSYSREKESEEIAKLKSTIIVKDMKIEELEQLNEKNKIQNSEIKYLENSLSIIKKKLSEETEKNRKLQAEVGELSKRKKGPQQDDQDFLQKLRLRESNTLELNQLDMREKLHKMEKDNRMLKELCRARHSEIKRLETGNMSLKADKNMKKNSNQMSSPIRTRCRANKL